MTPSELTIPMTTPLRIKDSWTYRCRIQITALCVIAGLCATVLTPPTYPEGTALDHWTDGIAFGLLLMAILLRLWAASHICGRKSKSLVTTGPYAICRNPLYVGTLLIAISQMMILRSFAFTLVCMIPIVLYVLCVVPAEEQVLRNRLGDAYLNYCRQVSRWFPRWSGLNFQWGRPEAPAAFRTECIRSIWWLLLPLASEFICGLRELITRSF